MNVTSENEDGEGDEKAINPNSIRNLDRMLHPLTMSPMVNIGEVVDCTPDHQTIVSEVTMAGNLSLFRGRLYPSVADAANSVAAERRLSASPTGGNNNAGPNVSIEKEEGDSSAILLEKKQLALLDRQGPGNAPQAVGSTTSSARRTRGKKDHRRSNGESLDDDDEGRDTPDIDTNSHKNNNKTATTATTATSQFFGNEVEKQGKAGGPLTTTQHCPFDDEIKKTSKEYSKTISREEPEEFKAIKRTSPTQDKDTLVEDILHTTTPLSTRLDNNNNTDTDIVTTAITPPLTRPSPSPAIRQSIPGAFCQRPTFLHHNNDNGFEYGGDITWGDSTGEPSPRCPPSHNNNEQEEDNSRLVQASPVVLPTEIAQPMTDVESNNPQQEEEIIKRRRQHEAANMNRKRGIFLALTIGFCLLALGLMFFLLLRDDNTTITSSSNNSVNETASQQQQQDQTVPPLLPWTWDLPFEVPNSTIRAIQLTMDGTTTAMVPSSSPQYMAYQWMKSDPNLDKYSTSRLQQRFAMVCFYFATDGTNWDHQGGGTILFEDDKGINRESEFVNLTSEPWLSYDTSECDWYSTSAPRAGGRPACGRSTDNNNNNNNNNNTLENFIILANNLGGTLPDQLSLLTSLKRIDFTRNKIGGTIPTILGGGAGRFPQLKKLVIHRNELIGEIPSQIGLLSKLTQLGFIKNHLTGNPPPEIWQMPELEELDLSDNVDLWGTIPNTIGRGLPKLLALQLARINFTGTLPASLGLLTDLEELKLHESRFTGSIPSELGLARNLETLFARSNYLSGSLPTELSQLEKVNLESNPNLTGPIPVEWVNVTILKLKGTSITGTIPEVLCGIRKLEFECSSILCGCGDCPCSNQTS